MCYFVFFVCIVVPLPPGTNPFAVNNSNNNVSVRVCARAHVGSCVRACLLARVCGCGRVDVCACSVTYPACKAHAPYCR
jgi:hypothetical protein